MSNLASFATRQPLVWLPKTAPAADPLSVADAQFFLNYHDMLII